MPYCGSEVSVKYQNDGSRLANVLSCRSWHCPECAPRRQARLMAEIIGGKPNRFLTLTSRFDPNKTPEQALSELNDAWRKLRQRICKYYGLDRINCLVVVEPHKTGWPHLHIFLRTKFLAWKWLRDTWEALTGNTHVHIRKIDNHGRAAAYAAKYCTKCTSRIGTKKRYYKSRGYELRPKPRDRFPRETEVYRETLNTNLEWVIASWYRDALLVDRINLYRAEARPPP